MHAKAIKSHPSSNSARISRAVVVLRPIGFALLAQIVAILVTMWMHLGALWGAHPESVQLGDAYAPGVALFAVSWMAARRRRWNEGFAVALSTIGLWVLIHLYLTTRFLWEFRGDGWPTSEHLEWWLLALCLGGLGGWLGTRFSLWRQGGAGFAVLLLALWGRQLVWGVSQREAIAAIQKQDDAYRIGRAGRTSGLWCEPDGTSILSIQFDLSRIDFDLADADWNDSHPFDNRNATWLGQPQNRVWNALEKRHSNALLCLVNGGFFGADAPYIARHEAPVLHDGYVRYPVSKLQEDWPSQVVTLAWIHKNGVLHPQIIRAVTATQLRAFEGALGGVRVLIENGKSADLRPGMGGTTLKCSRTSVAWNEKTFEVLSVRDPDGEASSLQQNRREKKGERGVQVGGWDVAQVQNYWKTRGYPNAVLFDGGESGQITLRLPWGVRSTQSSYHFTRTLGFLKNRPLRAVWPMWPPTMANGGVLNWFAVVEASEK